MTKRISQKEYRKAFEVPEKSQIDDPPIAAVTARQHINREALREAIATRRFEIELYWKRATYFWTFIAGTFAGFGAVQIITDSKISRDLSVYLTCIGLVCSVGWW